MNAESDQHPGADEPSPPQGSPPASGWTPPYAPPPGWAPPPSGWMPAPPAGPSPVRRVVGHWVTGWVVAALLAGAVVGLSVALANTSSAPRPLAARTIPRFGAQTPAFGGGGSSRAFGGGFSRALGGATVGTVESVAKSSFTMKTASGSTRTVDEQSSTNYRSGRQSATKSAVGTGDRVAVVGTLSGSTIKATSVTVLPASFGGF